MTPENNKKSLLDIFVSFFRIGCFTFGGGWSIIAQIQKEFVDRRKWITNEELLDYASVGKSLPGLMAANVCMILGYQIAGVPGAVCTVLGLSLPPFLIMIGITTVYSVFRDHPMASRALMGVRAAVVPIIVLALTRLFKAGLKNGLCYGIAIIAFLLCLFSPLNKVVIVLLGAGAAMLYREISHAVP